MFDYRSVNPKKEIYLPIINFQGQKVVRFRASWRAEKSISPPDITLSQLGFTTLLTQAPSNKELAIQLTSQTTPNRKPIQTKPSQNASIREQVKDIRRPTTCTTISIWFRTRSNVTTAQLCLWTTEDTLSGDTKSTIQGACRSECPATATLAWQRKIGW